LYFAQLPSCPVAQLPSCPVAQLPKKVVTSFPRYLYLLLLLSLVLSPILDQVALFDAIASLFQGIQDEEGFCHSLRGNPNGEFVVEVVRDIPPGADHASDLSCLWLRDRGRL